MSLSNAANQLIAVAAAINADPDEVQVAAARMAGELENSTKPELDETLTRLADPIAHAELAGAAVMALCSGAIVQQGGDPNIALDAILARLPEALMLAQLYAEACEDAGELTEDQDPIESFGDQIASDIPTNAAAFRAIEPLAMGAIAMLSRSPVGRVKARQDHPELADLAGDLAPFHDLAGDLEEVIRKI